MKAIDLALKDLLRSFRSRFLLTMMLVAPLLLTGLMYFAFGAMSTGGSAGGFNLPVVRVVVVNLDQPDGHAGLAAGKLLADHLASQDLASILQTQTAPDEANALAAVDSRRADAAVIIPAGFTAAVAGDGGPTTVRLYHDPVVSIGPGIVKTIVADFIDGFSGAAIAAHVAGQQLAAAGLAADEPVGQAVTGKYVQWVLSSQGERQLLAVRAPSSATAPPTGASQGQPVGAGAARSGGMIPLIMAAMLILFVFFTGGATASTIVTEDEDGTLARLFTTPTSQTIILAGKALGSLFTLGAQAVVLVLAAMLLFHICWGNPLTLAMMLLAVVVAATGFGVFVMSFVRTARQSGPILGAVTALTGIMGGLFTTFTPMSGALDTASLAVPQGWALRGMKLTLAGAGPMEVLGPAMVLFVIGVGLFAVGTLMFRRRFA